MKVDMSPEAVTARLRQVSELRRLCLSLRALKTPAKVPAAASSQDMEAGKPGRSGRREKKPKPLG